MNKETRHLARAGILLALIVVGVLAARQVMMPESFGRYGYYRGANVAEWANQPLTFSDTEHCSSCHSSTHSQWSQSEHASVSCENCHGPGVAHIESQQELTVDRSISLCLVCHEKLASRPSDFPQVTAAEHSPLLACIACHNPHGPAIGQRPAVPHTLEGREDCLRCHGEQGLKPVPLNHAGRTSDTCQFCHKGATP